MAELGSRSAGRGRGGAARASLRPAGGRAPPRADGAVPAVLLSDGRAMPAIGLGTFELAGSVCTEVVAMALEAGYRHLDTAEGYGNEEDVARGIEGFDRSALFLTSKVGREHLRAQELRRALERSLERLRTDYLDLYLVHWPNRAVPMEETIEALLRARAEGLVRSWGVSNFTMAHVRRAARLELPATNQVEVHPFFRQVRLARDSDELGVPLTAYSPLARGRALADEGVAAVARERGAAPAQVVLAWLLARGHAVLPKTSARHRLEENLAAARLTLAPSDLARLEGRPQGPRLFDYDWAEFADDAG